MKSLGFITLMAMLITMSACGYKADLSLPDQTVLEKPDSIESTKSNNELNEQKQKKNGTSRK